MERQVWCISHCDLDGMAAAAVVKDRYPNVIIYITNYGRNVPIYKCKPGDLVFVTDFSLPYNEFMNLRKKGCEIIWIDHHKDNYEQLATAGWTCEGIRRNDYCGAALTWIYLHPQIDPAQMPHALKLVNDYDLWLYNYGDETKNFGLGIGLWDMRPMSKMGELLWRDLLHSDDSKRFQLIIKYGEHIRQYVELWQDTICKDLAYYTDLHIDKEIKRVLAISVRAGNSSVFDHMDKTNVDAVFQGQFVQNIGKFRCSMYSPDNVKEILPIVKHFGGGGHAKAAGFATTSFPMPPPELKDPIPMSEAIAMYEELAKLKNGSVILKQWISKANSITMRSLAFHTTFQDIPALACNHNNLLDLTPTACLSTDCINPETALPAQVYIGFAMTNSGWYRCTALPTDDALPATSLLNVVKSRNPDAERTAILHDGAVWWYERDMPVYLPISTEQVPSM